MDHDHIFLGKGHEQNHRRTAYVMVLCAASMIIEIICGVAFGSLALIADGVHMGTHVIAFSITWFAYKYSAQHKDDNRFVFGTGKVGELAAYTCAIILIVISLVILYTAIERLIYPSPIRYLEAIPIGGVGLGVNILSGILLMGICSSNPEDIENGHGHSHGHAQHEYEYEDKGK